MEKQEISLTENQLLGLEKLGKTDIKKESWILRSLDWISSILNRTTKIWIICLEIIGVIVIFVIIGEVKITMKAITTATTELDFKKAEMMINALKDLAPSIATMVAVICGAIPGLVGVLRSLNKKWNGINDNNNNGNS